MGWCYNYFNNPYSTELFQLIFAFVIGVLFAPWNRGLLPFILFLVAYEVLYFYATHKQLTFWNVEQRTAVLFTSILGFIIGRSVTRFKDPIADKRPTITRVLNDHHS